MATEKSAGPDNPLEKMAEVVDLILTFIPEKKFHENKVFFDLGKFVGHSTRPTNRPGPVIGGNAPNGV